METEAPQAQAAGQDDRDYRFIAKAVDEAHQAVECGVGYPFGAVIARGDEEEACKKLGRIDLSDCEIYASCQPCPMFTGLIRLSKIKKVVYGAKAEVAAAVGFSSPIPDAFLEYYQKSGMEIRQAKGEAARIAEGVFDKTE